MWRETPAVRPSGGSPARSTAPRPKGLRRPRPGGGGGGGGGVTTCLAGALALTPRPAQSAGGAPAAGRSGGPGFLVRISIGKHHAHPGLPGPRGNIPKSLPPVKSRGSPPPPPPADRLPQSPAHPHLVLPAPPERTCLADAQKVPRPAALSELGGVRNGGPRGRGGLCRLLYAQRGFWASMRAWRAFDGVSAPGCLHIGA